MYLPRTQQTYSWSRMRPLTNKIRREIERDLKMSDEEEAIENKQRLKAAMHYSVGEICSQVEGMTFSREMVAVLTETTFKQAELLATDLELFARHAKRSTVSAEDVRLCSRRSPSLLQFITEQGEKLKAEREEQQRAGKEGGRKEGEVRIRRDDEEDQEVKKSAVKKTNKAGGGKKKTGIE